MPRRVDELEAKSKKLSESIVEARKEVEDARDEVAELARALDIELPPRLTLLKGGDDG